MKRVVAAAKFSYTDHYTYDRSGQKFSVYTKYADTPDQFQCQVSEIHPYDDAEYAWAKKDSPASATVYMNGKRLGTIDVKEWDEDNYEDSTEYVNDVIDTICVELRAYNRNVEPRMVHN